MCRARRGVVASDADSAAIATDGGASTGGWVLGNLGLDIGLDRGTKQTVAKDVSTEVGCVVQS